MHCFPFVHQVGNLTVEDEISYAGLSLDGLILNMPDNSFVL